MRNNGCEYSSYLCRDCTVACFYVHLSRTAGLLNQYCHSYYESSGITDFSYPRPFVPKNEKSLWRTFVPGTFRSRELSFSVPWNFRSQALSFSGTFVPGERKFLGTFVPGTFRTRELSFPLSDRSSRRFALCA